MQNTKVAIIGAGVSGLAAAVWLAQAGVRNLTIFEARHEAGGRTRSYVDSFTGDMLDNGQHLLLGCYRSTLEYVRIIASDKLLKRAPLSIRFHEVGTSKTDVSREAVFQISPSSKPPQNLLGAIGRSRLLTAREKLGAFWLGRALQGYSTEQFEGKSCADLFRAFRQPKETVRKLWEPVVLATINAPVERASATLFLKVLREAFLSGRDGSDFLIPECGLSELLVTPALRMLERSQATVRLSAPVRVINRAERGMSLVMDDVEEQFDAVIYSGQVSELLPSEVRSDFPSVEFSPIVNAYFWLDRTILNGPVHAFLGTTLQWAFPKPSNYSTQRMALTVSAANGLASHTNEEIRHVLWADLCAAVPAARETRLVHHQIIREKRATPLLTPATQSGRPMARTSIPNLFLAGDIVQNGLPATIEGAIRNGFAAAELLLQLWPERYDDISKRRDRHV